ncbi:XdhC family protein [Winslowiella iniecta]|uniref:XdhC family protein n=1 Tax=Winslowiella iniecta TaxID=1560201 RepID=UPI00069F5B14|nr:XdhC family protein [Winslowiella iniecta]
MSITDITYQCEFTDSAYFCLKFRQAFLADDSETILRFAAEALTAGMAAALVTLVAIRGGPPGAQMAVREDGLYCGFVSGGCVEATAAHEAMQVIFSGTDRTVIYGDGSPYFDITLPCGGGIALSIHKLRAARPFYIGALGSHRTHCQRVQKLSEPGWSRAETDRINAPIGIFPKARDAHSLALSVLADVAACRSGTGGK